ncbi:MAG: radical SAM protein [Desulfonatronovibrio sp. MSAO_Bac4]|nr:MAG: radical SAM protein [Desulfonatronovibrio sp. MSAO_Bac4]
MFDSNSSVKAWNLLRGFEPVSFCDWPGKVSAVLFFGGCNLRCPSCHNASFAWDVTKSCALDHLEIIKRIQKNRKWLDGLVLTGGEVTILPDFEELLRVISAIGLPVKIDTNGQQPDMVRRALCLNSVKKVAVDVKGPWEKYPHLCGGQVSSQQAMTCADEIFSMASVCPDRFAFRCTKVPGLTNDDIDTVKSYLPHGFELDVQKYIKPQNSI